MDSSFALDLADAVRSPDVDDHREPARGSSSAPAASPRAALVAALAAAVAAASVAGDLEAARVAHEALGRLLGAVDAASVVDLAAARAKRS